MHNDPFRMDEFRACRHGGNNFRTGNPGPLQGNPVALAYGWGAETVQVSAINKQAPLVLLAAVRQNTADQRPMRKPLYGGSTTL
jgi:hypothetical protein